MPSNNKRLIPIAVIVAAVVMYGIYSLYQTYWQNSEQIVTGTIEAKEIHLGVVMNGIVDEVLVEEGDVVREDQMLARVDGVSGGNSGRIRSPIDGVVHGSLAACRPTT